MSDKRKVWDFLSIPTDPTTASGLQVTVTSTGTLSVDVASLVNTKEAREQIEALRDLSKRQDAEEVSKSKE